MKVAVVVGQKKEGSAFAVLLNLGYHLRNFLMWWRSLLMASAISFLLFSFSILFSRMAFFEVTAFSPLACLFTI